MLKGFLEILMSLKVLNLCLYYFITIVKWLNTVLLELCHVWLIHCLNDHRNNFIYVNSLFAFINHDLPQLLIVFCEILLQLNYEFEDADCYHTEENIEKMKSGQALQDHVRILETLSLTIFFRKFNFILYSSLVVHLSHMYMTFQRFFVKTNVLLCILISISF